MTDFEISHKGWPKTPRADKMLFTITQKLDGTNVVIHKDTLLDGDSKPYYKFHIGSRNQWIATAKHPFINTGCMTPEICMHVPDQFKFAQHVYDNLEMYSKELPDGWHYGEWCGPKIQNGEGLKERTLFLFAGKYFDTVKEGIRFGMGHGYPICTVPILQQDIEIHHLPNAVQSSLDSLNLNGTAVQSDLLGDNRQKPEGIIVTGPGIIWKEYI